MISNKHSNTIIFLGFALIILPHYHYHHKSPFVVLSLASSGIPQPNRNFGMSKEEATKINKDTRIVKEDQTLLNISQSTPSSLNNNNNNNSSSSMKQSTMTSLFPTQALLPKAETKADVFLANHPKYDGRGIIVGILDTGIDPGAIGLSHLPPGVTGERKLIHVADCTGSGDVAMNVDTFAVKRENGWVIDKNVYGDEGTIVLNPDLVLKPFPMSSSQEEEEKEKTKQASIDKDMDDKDENIIKMPVRLGFKRLYELFPRKLTTRVKRHYAKEFEKHNHHHAVEVHRKLAAFNEKFATNQPTQDQLQEKEDLLARLEVLEGKLPDGDPLSKDPGPLCQIILFHDGKDYRVLIDIDKNGDLSKVPSSDAMTDFHKEGQYRTFSHIDMCNYAVNIYQEGKVVSVVVDAGAHASHVAGITARYQLNGDGSDDEANGVAPGAKLISLKIGDSRLGSMETGSALTRALIEAVKHNCDVINLSYGEGCAMPNSGRFVELAEEVVHKHGIVFVGSAGNNGPALTTVGAPGGTSSSILGVAAYVSPAMMEAKYCAPKDENGGTTYTWSSVGPCADGAQGVDVMAPGAAITCVPNWCLQKTQLMNGTSMSSPNAAGCIALLLSAAKAEGLKVTPARLRHALINCAENMNGSHLEQGWGMINVQRTWEYLKQFKDDQYGDINFKVTLTGRPGMTRGVYLRQPDETNVKQTFSAFIDPVFGTNDNPDIVLQKQRIGFEMKMALEVTEQWVEVPDYFMLMHNGRSFKFTVDPTELGPGLHVARILGYDMNNREAGPRFSVPITVTKTLNQRSSVLLGDLEFEYNEVKRFFLDVPMGASWMDVTVKDCREEVEDKESSSRQMVLHTIQLLPHNAYRDAETKKYLNLLPSQESVISIPVHSGVTCELALARYWSAQGCTKMNVSVEFHGVTASPDELVITAAGDGGRTRLYSALRNQEIKPEAKLKKWRTPLGPKTSIILPCDERDVLPSNNKQIHQLIMSYEFEQKEAGSFVPRAPVLQGHLYESGFESQIMLIFDESKHYLGVADSWPDEVHAPKGKITIRMQIRHDDVKMLELLKETTIWIERKLSSDIILSAYSSHKAMVTDGPKFKKRTLRKGTSTAVFFKEPAASKLPSECKTGDVLIGSVQYEDNPKTAPGIGHKPYGNSIRYIVGTKVESDDKSSKAKTPDLPDERSVKEKADEEIRSVKIEQLKKLMNTDEDATKFEEYYKELLAEYPDYIPLMMTALKYYDKKEKRMERIKEIIVAADLIISKINEKDLAVHFGMIHDKDDPKCVKERKEMEEKKSFLTEALARKAHAHFSAGDEEQFCQILKELAKWEDIEKNKKYAILLLSKYKFTKRLGLMIKLLNSLLEKNGDDTKDGIYHMKKDEIIKQRIETLKSLNYNELAERDDRWSRVTNATKEFALF